MGEGAPNSEWLMGRRSPVFKTLSLPDVFAHALVNYMEGSISHPELHSELV